MDDEIKEILDKLNKLEYDDIHLIICEVISRRKIKSLLDYITNLQEENEQLRTDINTFSNTIIEVNKECNSLFNHLTKKDLDYKSRIDKAIKCIKSTKFYGMRNGKTLLQKYLDDLINILNGGDE